jgi:CheY-like chemotaxis protein
MPQQYIAPNREEIAVGAYHVWEKERRPSGRQNQNWIEAEAQLRLFHQSLEVNLPIRQKDAPGRNKLAVAIQRAFAMPGSGKRKKTRQPRVLVVDDELPATHMLRELLRKHGYIAAELNDPTKAVPTAHRFQPDIVLLDMHMPWKDGHQVAADFASDDTLSCVPIIFITHDALDRNKSTDSIPVLLKPFSIEDLFACLEKGITRPV